MMIQPFLLIICSRGIFSPPQRTSLAFSDFPAYSQILLRQLVSYLKRVRVTPGVNRPLAQLNPGFRYLHWPGFISRTHPFGLATYCVCYPAGTLCSEARADLYLGIPLP